MNLQQAMKRIEDEIRTNVVADYARRGFAGEMPEEEIEVRVARKIAAFRSVLAVGTEFTS